MQAGDYWRLETAPPGSDLHYSLLGVDAGRRRIIVALHALQKEIGAVAALSEAGIAQAKLGWWRDEISRLYDGCPRHPISQALQNSISAYQLPRAEITQFIDAAKMDLDYDSYPDFQRLRLYCENKDSALCALQARVLGYHQAQTLVFARLTGIALALCRLLDKTSDALASGRLYIPADELDDFSVSYQEFQEKQMSAQLQALFHHQARRARDYRRQALAALPERDRYRQRSLIVLMELQMAWLAEIEADGFRLLQHRIMLTPLRKLWLAWRTGRRERRFKALSE